MNKIAIYIRVSTAGQSLDAQKARVKEEATRRGWTDYAVYADKASGGTAARGGLQELMADVRAGKVSAVVVTKLDRLARSLSHLVQVIQELRTRGVGLVTLDQPIDTLQAGPMADLIWQILGCVAEFERSLIRDRVKQGVATARAKGIRLGRPPGTGLPARRKIDARRIWEESVASGRPVSCPKLARAAGISRGTAHAWRREWEAAAVPPPAVVSADELDEFDAPVVGVIESGGNSKKS